MPGCDHHCCLLPTHPWALTILPNRIPILFRCWLASYFRGHQSPRGCGRAWQWRRLWKVRSLDRDIWHDVGRRDVRKSDGEALGNFSPLLERDTSLTVSSSASGYCHLQWKCHLGPSGKPAKSKANDYSWWNRRTDGPWVLDGVPELPWTSGGTALSLGFLREKRNNLWLVILCVFGFFGLFLTCSWKTPINWTAIFSLGFKHCVSKNPLIEPHFRIISLGKLWKLQ